MTLESVFSLEEQKELYAALLGIIVRKHGGQADFSIADIETAFAHEFLVVVQRTQQGVRVTTQETASLPVVSVANINDKEKN